jgi:transcriptional regulator with XRE-family HTH domain
MKNTDHPKKLGHRLKEERERLGFTQTALAKAIGVGRLTTIRYEMGDSMPSAQVLNDLNSVGVDIYYVVTGTRIDKYFNQGAMEKAINLLFDLVLKIDAKPDKALMVQALLHFYRSIIAEQEISIEPLVKQAAEIVGD